MSTSTRIDELRRKFDENPRRYFAPLANEYRKSGDLGQAIALCREHLPKQPGHMSGYIVFGQALYESGALAEARTVFEQALALDPENLIALRHLGDIAKAGGDPIVARRWYERVLDADPRNDDIAAQLASLATAASLPAAPAQSPLGLPSLPAVPSAVPSFGLGSLPTPDATLRAVDFDVVNKRMTRYTPLDLDAIEADAHVTPIVREPVAMDEVEAFAPEPATPIVAATEVALPSTEEAPPEPGADHVSFASLGDSHEVVRGQEHAEDELAQSMPPEDAGTVISAARDVSAHDASRSVYDALGAFALHDPTDELRTDHVPVELHSVDSKITAPSAESHEADDPFAAAFSAPTEDFDGADAFEEGIVAPEWPVAADVIASVATPRFFSPHVIHPTPDAIAAFGREPHEAEHPATDPAPAASEDHSFETAAGYSAHPSTDVADVAADRAAHLTTDISADASAEMPTDLSEQLAEDPSDQSTPEVSAHSHDPFFADAQHAGLFPHREQEIAWEPHDDESSSHAVAHADAELPDVGDAPADAFATELAAELPDAFPSAKEDVSLNAASDSSDSPLYVAAAQDTSLPWLSTSDEVGFDSDTDHAADEIAAMFESDTRAFGDDSAITLASVETLHAHPEPLPDEASFADVVAEADEFDENAEDLEHGLDETSASPAFMTETMAELLVAQGFVARAVTVYEELAQRHPADAAISARLTELRAVSAADEDTYEIPITDANAVDFPSIAEQYEDSEALQTPAFGVPTSVTPRLPTPAYSEPAFPSPAYPISAYPTPAYPTPSYPTPAYAPPLSSAALPPTPPLGVPVTGTPAYGIAAGAYAAFATPSGSAPAFSAPSLTARERFARLAARRVPRRTPSVATPVVHEAPDGLAALFGAGPAIPAAADDTAARAFADAFAPMSDNNASAVSFLDFDAPSAESDAAMRSGPRHTPAPGTVDAQATTRTPERANAGFSFDRFFPDPATRQAPPPAAAGLPTEIPGASEEAAPLGEDLAQFSAWLKGLGTT
jgi:hypothetical protein